MREEFRIQEWQKFQMMFLAHSIAYAPNPRLCAHPKGSRPIADA